MQKSLAAVVALSVLGPTSALTQQDLLRSDQAVDVQALTCAQLAGTWQEDADALVMWYSGWYNGLAKKHMYNAKVNKQLEHELIVYCKAHPEKKIIEGIAVVFKDERARRGIRLAD
jgi:hypothetical protein